MKKNNVTPEFPSIISNSKNRDVPFENSDIAVQLIDVSKKYEIHHEKPTLVDKFVKGKNEIFWAMKGINLTIKKGEKIGIIGPNGSGKTTLLKIISGITTPSMGSVKTSGKVISLIDLEAGFHLDLTGIQNIYLNGILLGTPKREIDQKLREIISFADIKQFIDAPVYTYSQGMMLRLGFSIAINVDPDILVLDENMIVGDIEFQIKSQQKIKSVFEKKRTIILVSHDMNLIKTYANAVIVLENGRIIEQKKIKMKKTK